ncbi:MAG: DUF3097 family protein [Microthrixaceae bacterium]
MDRRRLDGGLNVAGDPYGDILADRSVGGLSGARRLEDTYTSVAARADLPLLHRSTGLRGRLWKFSDTLVVLRTPDGREHTFENRAGAFAHQGETVTLVRPAKVAPSGPATKRSAAGGVVSTDAVARVAQASRLWVEGDHDARFMERVWGDELRELGIVVEPMHGIDDLVAAVAEFGPRHDRRLAILVDHLVPGSKETRLAEQVAAPDVLVVGHPFVDIWQCVRPKAVGIEAWPEVPRGEDWKTGICTRLGWGTPVQGWKRVLSSVDSFADLEPELVGAVERALDLLAPVDEP